jgi:hypothetical protein
MKSLARQFYETLPEEAKMPLRHLRAATRYVPFTPAHARAKWVRSYTAFQMGQRDALFKSIAYYGHVNRPLRGYYFEFGCHEANTMRLAWKHSRFLFDWTFVAFDSFEGFPDIAEIDRQEIWEPGKCATSESEFRRKVIGAGMPPERLMTVKGFYDRSLTPELRARLAPTKAAVIYIDCDLYESTVPILSFVRDFLQPGTVIVFDDWNCFVADPERGERRAFAEFRAANPTLHFEPWIGTDMQQAFIFVGDRPTR